MTNKVLFYPAYIGLALISVNLIGADPSDFIFLALAVLILIFNPFAYLFGQVSGLGKLGVAAFLILYAISALIGYKDVFLFYFIANLSMAIILSSFLSDERFRPGSALFFGFVAVNLVGFTSWLVGFWPESIFFDIFRDGRFLGTMGDPNFIGLMSAFSLYHFLDKVIRKRTTNIGYAINIIALALSLIMLLFSQSRSTWVAAAGGLVVYLIASKQIFSFKTVVAFFGLIVAVMTLATINLGSAANEVTSLSERFSTILVQNDAAEKERFAFLYTRVSLAVGLEHPLGVGPGMTFTYTGLVNVDGGAIGAHNAYVEIFTENGWLAAAVFLSLMICAWVRLFRLASVDAALGDISCRTILAGLTATALFGMGHDLIGWRIGWIFPSLAVLAAYHIDYRKISQMWSRRDWKTR